MASDRSDNLAALARYYEHLESAEFARAADQFTEDVTYVHPPMYNDQTHIHGRDALLSYFRNVRGPRDHRYHLDRTLTGDQSVAVVGYVTGPDSAEPHEYFVSYAELIDGRIEYYIGGLLGLN